MIVIALVFVCLFVVSWIVYELLKAPTMDDWHNECIKTREKKNN